MLPVTLINVIVSISDKRRSTLTICADFTLRPVKSSNLTIFHPSLIKTNK